MLGANGSWEEVDALGIARFTPGARIRALEEAIIVVRALACEGEPVTLDGEFCKVTKLMPAAAPTPPVWVVVGGPKGLAVTGRNADSWIPPHAADGLTRVPKLGIVETEERPCVLTVNGRNKIRKQMVERLRTSHDPSSFSTTPSE